MNFRTEFHNFHRTHIITHNKLKFPYIQRDFEFKRKLGYYNACQNSKIAKFEGSILKENFAPFAYKRSSQNSAPINAKSYLSAAKISAKNSSPKPPKTESNS